MLSSFDLNSLSEGGASADPRSVVYHALGSWLPTVGSKIPVSDEQLLEYIDKLTHGTRYVAESIAKNRRLLDTTSRMTATRVSRLIVTLDICLLVFA